MAIFFTDVDETEDNDDIEPDEKENLDYKSKVVPSTNQNPRQHVCPLSCLEEDATDAVGLSKRQLIYRINNGELAAVRDGRVRYVLISDLIKYAKRDRPIPPPKRVRGKGAV